MLVVIWLDMVTIVRALLQWCSFVTNIDKVNLAPLSLGALITSSVVLLWLTLLSIALGLSSATTVLVQI